MNYEQRIEVVNLFAGASYQKRIDDMQALGFEVISSTVNQTINGNQMVLTFRRNKDLKLYERFLDLDQKVKTIDRLILEAYQNEFKRQNKNKISRFVESVISALLLPMLVILELLLLLIIYNTKEWTLNDWLSLLLYVGFLIVMHVIERLWKKRVRGFYQSKHVEHRVKELTEKREELILEAKQLDHQIKA